MTQSAVNTIQVLNFTRSAIAPLMRATVIAAKVNWNPTKISAGMPALVIVSAPGSPGIMPLSPKNSNGPANRPPMSLVPNDIE